MYLNWVSGQPARTATRKAYPGKEADTVTTHMISAKTSQQGCIYMCKK